MRRSFFLKYTKTKRYSNLFIKDQGDSLLVFTIENFASIVLLLYPTLIFTGILEGAAAHIFLYALIVAPICGIVFGVCYFFNTGSYTPKDEA